jgi:hypothetical protein
MNKKPEWINPMKLKQSVPFAIALTALAAGCGGPVPYAKPALPATGSVAAAAGLPSVDTAAAQKLLSPDESLQTLDFPQSGTKTLSGRIEGYKSAAYALPVRQGQRLEVAMDTKSTGAYFNIQDARDTSGTALFAGEASGTNTALIRVPADATYVLRPYLNRAAARRGETADYTFKIERQ